MTTYVHIGIGKTGTTAIQAYLSENQQDLFQRGILFPNAGLIGSAHYGLFDLRTGVPAYAAMQELSYEILSNSDKTCVISSEHLSYAPIDVVEELKRHLPGDSKILLYVRDQVRLIESTFLQWIKEGWEYEDTVEQFFRQHSRSFDFMERAKPWVEIFGSNNFIAKVYDPKIYGDNLVQHFLAQLGVFGVGPPVERRNQSLLPEFYPIMRTLDEADVDSITRLAVVRQFEAASSILQKCSVAKLVSSSLASEIRAHYNESNGKFAELFLSKLEAELLCQ